MKVDLEKMLEENRIIKIFGPPGTGKTTKLLDFMEIILKQYHSNEICVMSHTKESVREFKKRAIQRFGLDPRREMEFFRTMHSICFKLLDLDVNENSAVIYHEDFCKKHRIPYNSKKKQPKEMDLKDLLLSADDVVGNKIFKVYNLFCTFACKKVSEVTEEAFTSVLYELNLDDVAEIERELYGLSLYELLILWEQEKEKNGWYDFSDMLLEVYKNRIDIPVKVILVDEMQDFGVLQNKILNMWKENKKKVIVVGDDDQELFGFAGSQPKLFLDFKSDYEFILEQSYRVPRKVWKLAFNYIKKNKHRKEKEYFPTDKEGKVEFLDFYFSGEDDFLARINPEARTFILFRTNYQKREFAMTYLIPNGIPFKMIGSSGSPWSDRLIFIHNAIVKLSQKEPLTYDELFVLLNAIPTKPFLQRGTKKRLKEGKIYRKESYQPQDLVLFGCTEEFFKLKTYDDFMQVLLEKKSGLTENQRKVLTYVNKNKLLHKPKIFLSTYHSIKGKEADDVFMILDLPARVYKAILNKEKVIEDERRNYYVGMTRTKDKLYFISHIFPKSSDIIKDEIEDVWNYARFLEEKPKPQSFD